MMMEQNAILQLSEAFLKLGVRFEETIKPWLPLYADYEWCVAAHDAKGLTGGFVIHAIPCKERISCDAWEEWYAFGADVSHVVLYASENESTTQTVTVAPGDCNHPAAVQNRTWHYYREKALRPLRGK